MIRNAQIILIFGLILSCKQDEGQPMDNPTQIDKYFLLKDFVEKQISLLDGAKVRKFTSIKGEEESSVLEVDAEKWRKELDIFIQADINKSALISSYETEENSNFQIHRLKPGEESPIQEMKVAYEGNQVSQISFISHQENLFYTAGSVGRLIVDTTSGKIKRYHVTGTQKVWFLSPNEMEVKGEIIQ
ncbi:MAG: hypothetical protein WD426_02560 [Anditalea sp.]